MLAKAVFPDSSLPHSPWSNTAGKDLLLICSPMPFVITFITCTVEWARHGARHICAWSASISVEQSCCMRLVIYHIRKRSQ